MPTISVFYGVKIKMFFGDHPPPHFHAEHGSYNAMLAIEDGRLIRGELPKRSLKMVREWCDQHRDELRANWDRMENDEGLHRIRGLDE